MICGGPTVLALRKIIPRLEAILQWTSEQGRTFARIVQRKGKLCIMFV